MTINRVVSGALVMVTGNFNPAIVQPDWLISNNVESTVPKNLIDNRRLAQNLSDFGISGVNYMTNFESLTIGTEIPPLIGLVDRLENIAKLLTHTPTTAINLTRYEHLRAKDGNHRTEIFKKLAPTRLWKNFGNEQEEPDSKLKIGLQTLTFKEDYEKDNYLLSKYVTIEPSLNQAITNDGIYIGVQFLYNLQETKFCFGDFVHIVRNEFDNRVSEAENIFTTIQEME